MKFSPAALQNYLPSDSPGTWWIALSGGLDSCVLLTALVNLKLPVKLHALHVNHQISPNANQWQAHCASICKVLNVPFTTVRVTVKNNGRGLEDAARAARYSIFEHYVKPGDYLLTAHHADDQAETLLLRLIRGAGPRGLAAMAGSRPIAAGQLHRPLLNFTRAELELYALNQGLQWVNDESNADDHYDRNFLRNQVMPLLRERWPHFAQKWQQTAELCGDTETLVEELASHDLLLLQPLQERIGTSICQVSLRQLSHARRHNVLRFWLRQEGLDIPEQQHLGQIEQQIIDGRDDAEVQVNWGNTSLRVFRQRVYGLCLADLPVSPTRLDTMAITPSGDSTLLLSTGGSIRFQRVSDMAIPLLNPDLPNLSIRFRCGGERCKPSGRTHSQTLKRLLQEYAVEPWLRESLPLIYSDGNLVAVGDIWICAGYQAERDGYRLEYRPRAN